MTPPAPGWYPDPHVPQQMRWWDGQAWTEDTYERTLPLDSGLSTPKAASGASAGPARRDAGGSPGRGADPASGTSARPRPVALSTTEDGVPLSGWGWRALARVIDGIVVNTVALIVAFPVTSEVLGLLRDQFTQSLQSAQAGAAASSAGFTDPRLVRAAGIISLVELLVSLVYEIGFLLWRQATPGKLLLGLRVRPWAVGARLTPTVVARRWLASEGASTLPSVGYVYYMVDVLWPLLDPKRQALHDKFAGTCVVRPRR
jgi:uncharacterized RDD family membrane protein YckC